MGLLNACKNKNYLYKQFINNKTQMNEIKHKNNLVNILQNNIQTYYNKLLEENENNRKKSWRIINEVIRRKKVKHIIQNALRMVFD